MVLLLFVVVHPQFYFLPFHPRISALFASFFIFNRC
jgi:hypothetical protein